MPPNIVVVNGADAIVPKIQEGPGTFTDLVGSSESAEHPIVAGIWHVSDLDETTPGWKADWDEVKYILSGELVIKNECNGEISTLTAGSLLWIPAGSQMSIIRSKRVRVLYVEQARREAEFGSG
ncbi:uncharacterized protein BHQ10_004068 [Talaromyces amestolkiae]|uniref:(S)-ureidoglycine aminohydrolase cupin domain-containing protein n=1 Tax=Talaromyces amestolkiae TaxID=1196081 RepID=A0A364KWW8_TALAM|nr:uncharacterized protein BHQ10_004068 [Talaromyces amestolkiae]RAO68056.1 hypothetical protein BHQ10_004068 [Talaromyces amestolkiae]